MKKQRVLLADDNKKFLEAASNMIKTYKVEIIGKVLSGEEAVKQTAVDHPDIVFMDLSMPGMGGLNATRMIKKLAKPPKVIILTLFDTTEYRKEAEIAGADGFISKSDFVDKIPDIFSGKLVQ